MKDLIILSLLFLSFLISPVELKGEMTLGLPEPIVPEDNPITPEKVRLGKKFYFDKRLSVDDTVSCATCHDPTKGFADGEPVSNGIKGQKGGRNAPSVLNAAYYRVQFWDGRAPSLEEQAKGPIVNPIEMGIPSHQAVVEKLKGIKEYQEAFQKVFGKFPRMVRDMSRNLGKDIDLEMFGEETEVDKTVIENIGDPLVHIIRNSIDHAIEFAEEREIKGKPKKGRIILSAYQKGTQIVIEVSDDGKGIDVESVKKKALSKGLISEEEAQRMSDDAAINLIFLPGFSTKEVSTELSGRGVGMDVVKTNVAKLNGYVEVITKKDIGSTFRISLPLTLAIIQAMMVRIGGEYYAIPQSMIEETLRVKKSDIKDVTGQKVLTIRGKVLPMFEMSEVLGVRRGSYIDHDNSYVLVATVGDRRFCISVDELLGQEEIVIKTINGIESEECGILGATITGDGKVVLILDPAVLSRGIFKTSNK